MKNKLYICKHQFVVSKNNNCDKCRVEESTEVLTDLLKSNVVTVDDNNKKIEFIKDEKKELILKNKSLEEQYNCSLLTLDSISENYNNLNRLYVELTRENNELKTEIKSKPTYISFEHKEQEIKNNNLKNKITELEDVIFNLKKENKYYKVRCERLIKEITDLNGTIFNGREENKNLKNKISELEDIIFNLKKENKNLLSVNKSIVEDYDGLEENFSELLVYVSSISKESDTLKTEHKSLKEKYHKMEEYLTSQEKEYNKLLDENRRIIHFALSLA